MAIEQWGFFNVPDPLRNGPTVYNGHLREPVTLTPVAERLAVELSLPFFTTWVCPDRRSNPDLPHARGKLYIYVIAAVHHCTIKFLVMKQIHECTSISKQQIQHGPYLSFKRGSILFCTCLSVSQSADQALSAQYLLLLLLESWQTLYSGISNTTSA